MASAYMQTNRLMGGRLEEKLEVWEAAKLSNPAISRLIYVETGLEVSRETVRYWRQGLRKSA